MRVPHSKLITTAVLVKASRRCNRQNEEHQSPLSILLACFVWAQAQDQNAPTQSVVTLPSSILDRELTTIDDRRLKLSDYSNRTIVLNLFASWCGPCRMNLPDLIDLKRSYGTSDRGDWACLSEERSGHRRGSQKFVRDQGINFQVVWDTGNFSESLLQTSERPQRLARTPS